jgi:hypothetical protein
MDVRDALWFAAGLLTALAASFALWPLFPQVGKPRTMRAFNWSAWGVLIVAVPALIFFAWHGDPNRLSTAPVAAVASNTASAAATTGHGPDSMDVMLARLERRLRGGGGTAADWELLAQTYEFLGRTADASAARGRHVVASPTATPRNAAGGQWSADLVAQVMDFSSSTSSPTPAGASAAPVQVIGEVTIAESLKSKVPAGLTLFIVAKSINAPGVPVAVVRMQTGQWPLKFRLDDSLAMVPGKKLSTAGPVTVEARVSQHGTATSQAGDMQSAPADVDPRSGNSVHLVIDHIIG